MIKQDKSLVEKIISSKDLKIGDEVYFKVENQLSGGYFGPTKGVIKFDAKFDEYYLDCEVIKIEIEKWLGAYVGSFEKV